MAVMNYAFEICACTYQSCVAACEAQASRVELCQALELGGLTPSYGIIKKVCQDFKDKLAIHVLIRNRSGDFCYNHDDLVIMRDDIKMCKDLGADGVVFGCLTKDGNIDVKACEFLLSACDKLNVTFHRAFDECADPYRALDTLINLNFGRLLTSGQKPNAYEGKELIKNLNDYAQDKITIMVGAGVNALNIKELANFTNCHEFHFSAKSLVKSKMCFFNHGVLVDRDSNLPEYDWNESSLKKILDIKNSLR